MAGIIIQYYRNYDSSDTTATGERYTSSDPLPTIEACGWESPSGYQLKEWNTNRDGSGLSFQPGDTISGGSPGYDLGKYAIWEREVISYITTNTELISVADAIRTKGGTAASLTYPTGFVSAINAIPTGGGSANIEALSVTQNGTYTAGGGVDGYSPVTVNVSGGGTQIVWGRIRGDAELAKSWTYDKLIHADEGVTIPAYTTASQTLKSGSALTYDSLNFADYSYILLFRSLAAPIYSNSEKSEGRQIYAAYSGYMPMVFVPWSAFDHDGTAAGAANYVPQFNALNITSFTRVVYYSSATSVRFQSNSSYGANFGTLSAPSVTISKTSPYDTGALSITSQNFTLRGSNTYLNSTNWGYMTDIRYQYIYELWRAPASSTMHGWEVESQFRHILDCANGTGTLT